MRRIVLILGILAFVMIFGTTQASAGEGNGHSFAWFQDADGDGIPNGMDDDWIRPENGSGFKLHNRFGLFGIGAFFGNGDGGKVDSNQYRHRKNNRDGDSDCLNTRLQLRDGSCK